MRPFRTAFSTAALLACLTATASAQSVAPSSGHTAGAAATPTPTQIVSGSPLSLMFGVLSAEYEKRLSGTSTIGASGTLYSPTGWSYTSAEAKYRYYPNGALKGFSIGGTGGVTRISAKDVENCDFTDTSYSCSTSSSSANAATFGVELDYQWLLGTQKNFVVATGLGAKKLVFLGNELNGASGTLPTVRLGVGYAF